MTAHHIRYEVEDGGIGLVTIDRPQKRNATVYVTLAAFIEAVGRARLQSDGEK